MIRASDRFVYKVDNFSHVLHITIASQRWVLVISSSVGEQYDIESPKGTPELPLLHRFMSEHICPWAPSKNGRMYTYIHFFLKRKSSLQICKKVFSVSLFLPCLCTNVSFSRLWVCTMNLSQRSVPSFCFINLSEHLERLRKCRRKTLGFCHHRKPETKILTVRAR